MFSLGILPPVADGFKLVFKEDIIPAKTNTLLFTLGLVIVKIPVILSYLIVQFGQDLVIAPSNTGVGLY